MAEIPLGEGGDAGELATNSAPRNGVDGVPLPDRIGCVRRRCGEGGPDDSTDPGKL